MLRSVLRHAALPCALFLLTLTYDARAQDAVFPNNATINYTVNGNAFVGYPTLNDYFNKTNPTSPTVTLNTGGDVTGGLFAYNSSTVNVVDGVASNLGAYNSSSVNITGGGISHNLYTYDTSRTNVSAGNIDGFLITQGNSRADITGGAIGGNADAVNSSTLDISGGSIAGHLDASNKSTVSITGGNIGGYLAVLDQSTLNLFGTGLGASLVNPNSFGFSQYTLSGTLNDGTSISGKTLYVENGRGSQFRFNPAPAVPEGGSFGLMLTGVLPLAVGVWRRRK